MQFLARPLSLPFGALLAVYIVVPLFLLVVVVDQTFFQGALGMALPRTPEQFFWYLLLFNVPHHIGSLFSFADGEYVSRYKSHLIIGLPIVWGIITACYFFAPILAIVIFVLYTEYHTLNQEMGIAGAFIKKRLVGLVLWRWSTVAIMATFFVMITYPQIISASWYAALVAVMVALSVVQACATLFLFRQVHTSEGQLFFTAIVVSLGGFALAMAAGYPLIALFMTRFIHDVTAFMVYAVHDHNRNAVVRHNVFYRFFERVPLPMLALTPILAVLIAAPFTFGLGLGSLVLLILFMSHYYLEGVVWHRGTAHREQVSFSAPHATL